MPKPVPLTVVPAAPPAFTPTPADTPTVLEIAGASAKRGVRGAMATVLSRTGSAPSTPGQKLYAAADGTCVGSVGGGAVEREVLELVAKMIHGGEGAGGGSGGGGEYEARALRTFRLGPELAMCCGGSVEVLVEPIDAFLHCLLVGGGHVASAVGPLLAKVGFCVTIVDAREEWGNPGRVAGVRSIVGDYDDAGKEIPTSGAVLVMTHDHALDQRAIEWALKRGYAFVGGVGSRAKAQRTKDRLAAKGFSEQDRERVKMPLGVSIGARLPDEIAVAIAAEMVTWRRSR
jgi:xanthine dehydrogenase accessory factor